MNILITSVGGHVPLIRAAREACNNVGDSGKVFGGDLNPACVARRFLDGFWQMPELNRLSVEDVLNYCSRNSISVVLPTRDQELLFFSINKGRFLGKGIHVMVSGEDTIRTVTDKLAFFHALERAGRPGIPTFANIDELSSDLYCVKERYGTGSRRLGSRLSKREAIAHARQVVDPLFQPHIEGTEYSADVYVDNKGRTKGAVVRVRDLIQNGAAVVTTTVRNPVFEEACAGVAQELGLRGHGVIQFMVDGNGKIYFLECNARWGSASSIGPHVGLKSLWWFLLESMGVPLDTVPFIRSGEKRQVLYTAELVFDADEPYRPGL